VMVVLVVFLFDAGDAKGAPGGPSSHRSGVRIHAVIFGAAAIMVSS